MSSKSTEYIYSKLRKNFGRQPLFSNVQAHMLDSIFPNVKQQEEYVLRNPVNQAEQFTVSQKTQEVNTNSVVLKEVGVNHSEGGWPKDILFADEEATTRYRRRFERDDCYVNAVLGSYNKLVHCIKQNNAIEMYQMFFRDVSAIEPVEKSILRLNNIYKDKSNREISSLAWTLEYDSKLVVAYCNKEYPVTNRPINSNLYCYVWDLENPNLPSHSFLPPSACWQAICSPINPSVILGGMEDGRISVFDIRSRLEPEMISPTHLAHRDPVSAVVYMQSRLNMEFFSGSRDGSCMWWDIRNLSNSTDFLIMSVRVPPGEKVSLSNSEGVNVLQYEKSFPTRFMCGTDSGFVINVNRKGKTPKDILAAVFEAHHGPVRALHRSPCTSKMFITCGDWTVHVWSDDVSRSPIVTGMPHRYQINDVAWAPQRLSCYMSIDADGILRYWDLLRKYHEPIKTMRITKNVLLKIKPHEEGRLIAIGDAKGNMYLVSVSENMMISGDQDKQLMLQSYERETHRERILEARVKEIRLKLTTDEKAVGPEEDVESEEADSIRTAEEEYRKIVNDKLRHVGLTTSRSLRTDAK